MPIHLPPGFLTRPEAAKLYNRSQRALERELDPALAVRDEDVLVHWKLATKDGTVREGRDVTTEIVKQLVADGMAPAWCVEEAWLQEKYGRKGEPRPTPAHESRTQSPARADSPANTQHQGDHGGGDLGETSYLQREVEFLKEQLRILEREKQQEIERNEKREAKLFAQLEVKDRQISAWDEITQGITKALATGQIAPSLLSAPRKEEKAEPSRQDDTFIDVQATGPGPSPEKGSQPTAKSTAQKKRKAATKRKTKKSKPAPEAAASTPADADFFSRQLPTFTRLLRRTKKR